MENKETQNEAMSKYKEVINKILKKAGIEYGMDVGGINYIVNAHKLAPYLQPKLPKDSVVLSIQEHEKDIYTAYYRGYKKGKNETAEKYFDMILNVIKELKSFEIVDIKDIIFL